MLASISTVKHVNKWYDKLADHAANLLQKLLPDDWGCWSLAIGPRWPASQHGLLENFQIIWSRFLALLTRVTLIEESLLLSQLLKGTLASCLFGWQLRSEIGPSPTFLLIVMNFNLTRDEWGLAASPIVDIVFDISTTPHRYLYAILCEPLDDGCRLRFYSSSVK